MNEQELKDYKHKLALIAINAEKDSPTISQLVRKVFTQYADLVNTYQHFELHDFRALSEFVQLIMAFEHMDGNDGDAMAFLIKMHTDWLISKVGMTFFANLGDQAKSMMKTHKCNGNCKECPLDHTCEIEIQAVKL